MSLLEDVFLQDEANEARELERVIDGDEYDERPRSVASNSDENSAKEDEAEEEKRRVDPTTDKPRRVVKNPRFILNPARLTGPRGIQVIPEHFKDFKFKGKGHEKEDLDLLLKKLEHWAYRLYPKFEFEDCLKKIETLGKKKPVMVHLHKIRSDQFQSEEIVDQKDSCDDEDAPPVDEDEFDKLLQQQIDLARATPAPDSVRKTAAATPRHVNMSPFAMPKATSSPSISEEQRERMLRNRKLAEERRLARLKQNTINTQPPEVETARLTTLQERISNANENIDSSDEENNVVLVNQSVTVEVNPISNREVEVEKPLNNEHRNTDDDIDQLNDSNKITQAKIVESNIEMSETYTEQQDNMELISADVVKEQDSELDTPDIVDGEKDEEAIGIVGDKEITNSHYMEMSETYTEQQGNMELASADVVKEQDSELDTPDIVDGEKDKEAIEIVQDKEITNSHCMEMSETYTEQQVDMKLFSAVPVNEQHRSKDIANEINNKESTKVQDLDNAEISCNRKSFESVPDNIEKENDKGCNVRLEKDNIPKSNPAVIDQDNHVSETNKLVEEDLMDVDFDDEF